MKQVQTKVNPNDTKKGTVADKATQIAKLKAEQKATLDKAFSNSKLPIVHSGDFKHYEKVAKSVQEVDTSRSTIKQLKENIKYSESAILVNLEAIIKDDSVTNDTQYINLSAKYVRMQDYLAGVIVTDNKTNKMIDTLLWLVKRNCIDTLALSKKLNELSTIKKYEHQLNFESLNSDNLEESLRYVQLLQEFQRELKQPKPRFEGNLAIFSNKALRSSIGKHIALLKSHKWSEITYRHIEALKVDVESFNSIDQVIIDTEVTESVTNK